jgi:hypothetical protein
MVSNFIEHLNEIGEKKFVAILVLRRNKDFVVKSKLERYLLTVKI